MYLLRPETHLIALLGLQGHVNWSPTKGCSLALGDYSMLMGLGVSRSKLNKHPLLPILYGKISRLSGPWGQLVRKNYVQETSADAARLSQATGPVLVGVLSAWPPICVSS